MFMKEGFFFRVLGWGLGALACLGLFLALDARADTAEVSVRNFEFDPQDHRDPQNPHAVVINVGDTVRWTAVDAGHTVTSGGACDSPDGVFDSGVSTLPVGATFTHTFTRAGTFPYFCRPHCSIGMTGVVKVAGAPPGARNKPPTLKLTLSNNSPNKKSKMIDEGETETITAVARDPNGDVVFLDATGLPPGAEWNPASGKSAVGIFRWTPETGTATTQPMVTVVFSATDSPRSGAPLTRTQAVLLTVGQNSSPQLGPIQPPPAIVGKPLKFTVMATDPDGDKLKFLPAQGLPEGATFRPKPSTRGKITGVFKWKPRADQTGREFRVVFTVQDNFLHPAQDSEEVVFTVAPQ